LSLVLVSASTQFDDGPEYWLAMTEQVIMT